MLSIASCGGDDIDYGYQATIMSPSVDDKNVGDSIHIHVNFESTTGEVVHNVAVKIYDVMDHLNIIYDYHSHVHSSTLFEHHADVVLDAATGVIAHTDWILEAKVYGPEEEGEEHEHGEEAEEHTVIETIQFHVHP